MSIVIRYDGTDITNNVLFASASFESQLGAFPGTFELTVKDMERTLSFATGKEITLDIDGSRYYGGYVTQVTRTFAIPVDRTDDINTVKTRQWVLRGVDYNILFDKRVVFNKATPTSPIPLGATSMSDQTAISTLCNDYLDLSTDGLDVSTFVDAVGDPTPTGEEFGYVNPGDAWRKQMEEIAQFTGAIWYLDASKKLHYQAQETVTPAWGFSDKPNNTTTFGFRDFEFTEDASRVANDALVWGGSEFGSTGTTAATVFARTQNTDSQSLVGRWQFAETHFNQVGYFEEEGCEIRGQIIVYGEAGVAGPGLNDPNRGLQYPQKQVKLSWFQGGTPTPLVPGTLVNIFVYSFGPPPLQLSLPVRSVRISFPTPAVAKFDGFFGIQTSDPWSLWKYMKKLGTITRTPSITNIVTSDGSGGASVPGTQVCMTPSPAPDGSTTVFTVTDGYVSGTTQVWLNGLIQRRGIEYTDSDPVAGQITFNTAPVTGDQLWVCYYSSGA